MALRGVAGSTGHKTTVWRGVACRGVAQDEFRIINKDINKIAVGLVLGIVTVACRGIFAGSSILSSIE